MRSRSSGSKLLSVPVFCLGLLAGGCAGATSTELDLEYVCVDESPRGLKNPYNLDSTLKTIYEKSGIEVNVRPLPGGDCVQVEGGTPSCFPLASVNALIHGGTGLNPNTGTNVSFTALKQGRTQQTPADSWYTFGLAIPAVCDQGGEGAIFLDTPMAQGAFECGYQQGTQPRFERENFLINTRMINPIEYTNPPSPSLLKIELEELAHVLNTHHAELQIVPINEPVNGNLEPVDYEFGTGMNEHLVNHRENVSTKMCVEPGSQGAPWCCFPEPKHMSLHKGMSECASLDEVMTFEDEQDGLLNLNDGANFGIRAEKEGYIVGEPVRISVKISDKFAFLFYPDEVSLDPRLGYLRLWTTRDSESGEYWPLSHLLHADADLDKVELSREVSASGIDTWFDRHIQPVSVTPEGREYSVRAAYSGLEYREKGSRTGRDLIVVSEPLLIEEEAPQNELFDPNALELFTKPEAKLFMFMLGGDHLGEGMKAMKVISQKYSKTIYAPYANLALGVNLSRPFYFFDGEREIKKRDPVPDQAGVYLEAALGRVEDLPPSYRRELYQALCDVEVMQGDQSGSSEDAGGHYDSASGYCKSLLLLEPPISQTKEEADQDVKDQIEEIDKKINEVP